MGLIEFADIKYIIHRVEYGVDLYKIHSDNPVLNDVSLCFKGGQFYILHFDLEHLKELITIDLDVINDDLTLIEYINDEVNVFIHISTIEKYLKELK